MRLLTLNIRFGAGADAPHRPGYNVPSTSEKVRAVADAIASVDPDVAALQEVKGARQAERIAGRLGMKHVYTRHPTSYPLDFFEWGLALCFRSKLLHVDNPTLEASSVGRSRRKLLVARLACDDGPLTLANVHLNHGGIDRQIQQLADRFDSGQGASVLMGDFNCLPDDGSWAPIEGRWVDSCRVASTGNSLEAERVGTLIGKRTRIDYIRVDSKTHRVLDAGLLPAEHRRVSDHIGYYTDIRRVSAGESG